MGKRSKEQQAAYVRKIDSRKNRLIELASPVNGIDEAFQRVRQIYRDEPDTDMIAAYDRVIEEAEEATS